MNPFNFMNQFGNKYVFDKTKKKVKKYEFEFEDFENVSFKDADLTNSKFRHCTFTNCYFRGADLSKTSLSGSHFINCNFKEVKFHSNMMENTSFNNCDISEIDVFDSSIKIKNHPTSRLAKNLRINAFNSRRGKEFFKMLKMEKKYLRKHYLGYIFCKKGYYRDNFTFLVFLKSLRNYLLDIPNRFLWGYSYGVINMLFTAILILLGFGIGFYCLTNDFINSLILTITGFSTLGFIYNDLNIVVGSSINILLVIEALVGAIYIAVLASVIYSRFTKVH